MVVAAMPLARPAAAAAPAPLKAVFIVGPTNELTDSNLRDAEALAVVAEELGMDVRRVFFPNATWENVLANIQGANLVYYAGHGYGWPSPYTAKMTESRQNGMGLNSYAGSSKATYTYYGANMLRQYVTLAPNAIVFLNHLCYSAGNAESGMAIPTYDVARQRVDNMANGWLSVGAKAVFAYPQQLFTRTLRTLFTSDMTVEDIFRIPGSKPLPYYGWIGWNPKKFDSVRTPGATNFLDPHATSGFYRAITGDLTLTGAQWAAGTDGGGAPTMSALQAAAGGSAALVNGSMPFFTPDGDGVSDSLPISYAVDKEAFVDFVVRTAAGDVIRTFSTWSPAGSGNATWDGKNDAGGWVADGQYTVTGTPRNRAGQEGSARTINVKVLTTMRAPTASPAHFYAADGDAVAATTKLSVTLEQPATFTWKIVDANNDPVRTKASSVDTAAGLQTWAWDGKNDAGAYVPDGTYYSVMTAATAAGAYSHRLPIEVRAFRLTTAATAPFSRGTQTKVVVFSAEKLGSKPKIKVWVPGLTAVTYGTYKQAGGSYYVTVKLPAKALPGTVRMNVFGFDAAGQRQATDYFFELK
jgi:flagellar hook assembly protein FlgD